MGTSTKQQLRRVIGVPLATLAVAGVVGLYPTTAHAAGTQEVVASTSQAGPGDTVTFTLNGFTAEPSVTVSDPDALDCGPVSWTAAPPDTGTGSLTCTAEETGVDSTVSVDAVATDADGAEESAGTTVTIVSDEEGDPAVDAPATVGAGDDLSAELTGLVPGRTYDVKVTTGGSDPVETTVTAAADGTATATVTIPSSATGTGTITVTDPVTGEQVSDGFVIEASLDAGSPWTQGDEGTVTASGLEANHFYRLTITRADGTVVLDRKVTSTAEGTLSLEVTATPTTYLPGDFAVALYDREVAPNAEVADDTLTVEAPAGTQSLTATGDGGTAPASSKVSGSGFIPGYPVTVTATSPSGDRRTVRPRVDDDGNFTTSFELDVTGTWTISATQAQLHSSATVKVVEESEPEPTTEPTTTEPTAEPTTGSTTSPIVDDESEDDSEDFGGGTVPGFDDGSSGDDEVVGTTVVESTEPVTPDYSDDSDLNGGLTDVLTTGGVPEANSDTGGSDDDQLPEADDSPSATPTESTTASPSPTDDPTGVDPSATPDEPQSPASIGLGWLAVVAAGVLAAAGAGWWFVFGKNRKGDGDDPGDGGDGDDPDAPGGGTGGSEADSEADDPDGFSGTFERVGGLATVAGSVGVWPAARFAAAKAWFAGLGSVQDAVTDPQGDLSDPDLLDTLFGDGAQ